MGTGMKNPFIEEITAHRKGKPMRVKVVRSEREAPKVLRGAELALAERNKQLANSNREKKSELKALMEGPWSIQVGSVISFLRRMEISDGSSLLALLDALDWFETASHGVRMQILGIIDDAIVRIRICSGLAPVDDALPGDELTIFQMIRAKLNHEETINE